MIEILNSMNQTQDFDQELIKEIKNIFVLNEAINPF
jgi:hypothetical protein